MQWLQNANITVTYFQDIILDDNTIHSPLFHQELTLQSQSNYFSDGPRIDR